MSKYGIILICIVLLTCSAIGQTIPKKANKVTVANVSVDKAIGLLQDQGYIIKNTIANTVTTEYKEIEQAGRMRLIVRIKDSAAIVTGQIIDGAAEIVLKVTRPIYISNRGLKNSGMWFAWNRFKKYVEALGPERQYLVDDL